MEHPIHAVDDGHQIPDIECLKLNSEILARLEQNDPDLSGLKLVQDGWFEGAGRAIGGNKHLKKLSISIGYIGYETTDGSWIGELCREGLSLNQSIESLSLLTLNAGMDGLDIFPTILQHNCNLRCIQLTEILSETSLDFLASALSQSKNDRLECIEVHSCGVTNAQFAGFCNALSRQKNLSSLKFLDEGRGIFSNDTILDDENATILRNFLIGHKSLKSFQLDAALTVTGWNIFSTALSHPKCSLETLVINASNDDVDNEIITRLGVVLEVNNSLKYLRLGITRFEGVVTESVNNCLNVISRVLCDLSSIQCTSASNHTLQNVHLGDDDDIWNDIPSFLRMNRNVNKAEVARQKILTYHFDGGNTNLHVFSEMSMTAIMPHAIEWIGRNGDGLTMMYNLLRGNPTLVLSR
ncbi:hypothetical protein ACHAWU_000350 [Discostella pseudostelligera]|uniref:RNI-like protein n=1 Tax=Discostella pseudostelligera TaxID=259834 RepID=A0ABD3M4Q3_9STRA